MDTHIYGWQGFFLILIIVSSVKCRLSFYNSIVTMQNELISAGYFENGHLPFDAVISTPSLSFEGDHC